MTEPRRPAILVVDDDDNNRFTLTRRLKRIGDFAIDTAENGAQALAMAAAQPYDLIFLDIMMPGMNGYDVLARMQADPALRRVPVLVISAIDEIDSVVKCIELGAADYLTKPFNLTLLKARTRACLEQKRLTDLESERLRQIETARQRADELLQVILPQAAVAELKQTDEVKPRRHDDVAVLFADLADFTAFCDRNSPEDVVAALQTWVARCETIAADHGLEKIKTIGDAFMATGGLLAPIEAPVRAAVECGLAIVAATRDLPAHWGVRVGVHVGPVVAGVMGRRQYQFDVWGDTVNVAARVCAAAPVNAVAVSRQAAARLDQRYAARPLASVEMKGKGVIELFECLPAELRAGAG
ncbi:MAG: response regulator [Alphaproteobacteria bacterium]|nr:response regulator [Alphaproteobacteria bacterium]